MESCEHKILPKVLQQQLLRCLANELRLKLHETHEVVKSCRLDRSSSLHSKSKNTGSRGASVWQAFKRELSSVNGNTPTTLIYVVVSRVAIQAETSKIVCRYETRDDGYDLFLETLVEGLGWLRLGEVEKKFPLPCLLSLAVPRLLYKPRKSFRFS